MKPALYLLPGLLCDATVWRAQVEHLSDIADVRVPDYGDANRMSEMAQVVLDTAPDSFSLAGHSMGARVALEVVRLAPDRIVRLALLDTGVHGVKPDERQKRMRLVEIARKQGMAALCEAWLPPMVHPARRKDEAFLKPLRTMVEGFTPERFAAQIEALLMRPDTGPALAAVEGAPLIGVGREDEWSPVDQHRDILTRLGRGRLAIFEEAGHMAPFEAPQSVNSALREWFETARGKYV